MNTLRVVIFFTFASLKRLHPVMIISRYAAIKQPLLLSDGAVIFSLHAGDPAEFLKSSYRRLNLSYPKFFKMDNLCKLAFLTTEILLKEINLPEKHLHEKTGLIIINASSSLETDEKHQDSINDPENYFPSPSVFVYTLPNIMAGEIAIRHKIKGENAVMISEKPDPQLIFSLVSELFTSGRVSCCITGWIEAYHNQLSSCLLLVEGAEMVKSYGAEKDFIIFDAANIERILKENLKNGID